MTTTTRTLETIIWTAYNKATGSAQAVKPINYRLIGTSDGRYQVAMTFNSRAGHASVQLLVNNTRDGKLDYYEIFNRSTEFESVLNLAAINPEYRVSWDAKVGSARSLIQTTITVDLNSDEGIAAMIAFFQKVSAAYLKGFAAVKPPAPVKLPKSATAAVA